MLRSQDHLNVRGPKIAPLKPSEVYDTYWKFAAERQRVFFQRVEASPPPWTSDPVLLEHKFTNAYRASDRVSQYLIRNVIYRDDLPSDPAEVVFRTLLFKFFNRIETWELLEEALGNIVFEDYTFKRYDQVLNRAMARGTKIYSAAYIMPSGSSLGHARKHQNNLTLIEQMMADDLPVRLAEAKSMQRAFDLLRGYPTIGDFLAYQFVTDLNYSTMTDFTETEFVVPGPGAVDGIRKCFIDTAGMADSEIIKFMADRQEIEFERLGIDFQDLWGRRLQLIDCQNLFCEVGKYARIHHPNVNGVSGRKRIKQRFRPCSEPIPYWYPPKWKINNAVSATLSRNSRRVNTQPLLFARSQPMDLRAYQEQAATTDQKPLTEADEQKSIIIPLLGLAGEAGELLSEYKKFLRDGDSHRLFRERFAEELGDMLWYLANVATKFDLNLSEIAEQNLAKCQQRFGRKRGPHAFDSGFPKNERLPRQFQIDFTTVHDENDKPRMKAYYKAKQFGNDLTDNAYDRDGYRFHDVFHLAFAAVLGWSPISRSLLERKRKSKTEVDEVEDGGRAKAIEEGISALIFAYAKDYRWLDGKASISSDLLRTVKSMTAHLEVSACTTGEWENAIIQGFTVWREIKRRGGGTLLLDLDKRTLTIKEG
jgi:NTP pyrophosphatase (non-canonical NTP hydrolase)